MIEIPYRGETIAMPIHLYSTDGRYECRPVLMAGVDTFKMDFHPWCLAFTMNARGDHIGFRQPWHRRVSRHAR